MSYEIVYNRQFLKIDDKIIPLVLHGSNNCYESMWNGRYRRERNWSSIYFNQKNTMISRTEKEIIKYIDSICGGTYQEHFIRNGKWVDDIGLIRFFKNGIKVAKTIEEMQETYFFKSMEGYFSIYNSTSNIIENKTEISSSDDLRKFLEIAQQRLDNRADEEDIYVCLRYYGDKFVPRNPKTKTPKERLTDYYAIKVNDIGYLTQLTSRRIRYCSLCKDTKQFKTEKEANKYIDKLKDRFYATFEVKHIVS